MIFDRSRSSSVHLVDRPTFLKVVKKRCKFFYLTRSHFLLYTKKKRLDQSSSVAKPLIDQVF